MLIYDKIKNKNPYRRVNAAIKEIKGSSYIIKIAANYENISLNKNNLYTVDYKLLNKCTLKVWNNLLEKANHNENNIEDIISEEEKSFILKNKDEFE